MESVWPLAAFVVLLAVWVRGEFKAVQLLRRWAEDGGFVLADYQRRFFWSRFWWRQSKSQRVYDVVLLGADGQHRRAQACVGHWIFGTFVEQVVVEFTDKD